MLRDFNRPRLWLGIWLFGWALCIGLSLSTPLPLHGPQDSDKAGHFLAYFVLTAWAMQLFARPWGRRLAALSLFALGLAMEVAQATLTTNRLGDPTDLLANTLGILAALTAFAIGSRPGRILLRLDDRLFRQKGDVR